MLDIKDNIIFNQDYALLYKNDKYLEKSMKLFLNYLDQINQQDLSDLSLIDFGCGNGDFCDKISALGIYAEGVDISESMIKVAKTKYPYISFFCNDMVNYKSSNKFDVVTCNYDSINHLLTFQQWEMFLKNVNFNLKNDGYFLFDFVTTLKMKEATSVGYNTNGHYDSFNAILPINDYQVINKKIYYIKENENYKKIEQTIIESVFCTKDVFELLKKYNFEVIKVYNKDLNETNDFESKRLFVICKKIM